MRLSELRSKSSEKLAELVGKLTSVKFKFSKLMAGGQSIAIPNPEDLSHILEMHHTMISQLHIHLQYQEVFLSVLEKHMEDGVTEDERSAIEAEIKKGVAAKITELQAILDEADEPQIVVPDKRIVT